MWDSGEQGHQLSQQTPGFPKGKNIKAEETDYFPEYSFSAWDLTKLPELPFSSRTFSSLSVK